jgi:putative hydrolase
VAVAAGCDLMLGSDAHAVPHLEFDAYAAAIAMAAEVPRERVVNVKHAEEFEAWLAER